MTAQDALATHRLARAREAFAEAEVLMAASRWNGALNGEDGPLALMPPIGSVLTDEQIASVLPYVRRGWGQTGTPVDADEVGAVRSRDGRSCEAVDRRGAGSAAAGDSMTKAPPQTNAPPQRGASAPRRNARCTGGRVEESWPTLLRPALTSFPALPTAAPGSIRSSAPS